MGFLSGVLGAVKDENEVTTYDNYLSEGERLNKVLETLSKKIGTGRTGLAASVEQVKGWLEGWEGEVNSKITAVTTPIEGIKTAIEGHIKDAETPKKSIAEQINEWTTRADKYIAQAKKADKALKEIDSKLKDKLKCPINMLLQATKKLEEEAANRDLEELNKTAAAELGKLQTEIDSKVKNHLHFMGGKINDEFNEQIRFPIEEVNKKLTEAKTDLDAWIKKAELAVEKAKKKCDHIVEKLKGEPHTRHTERGQVTEAAEQLKKKANVLKRIYEEAKKKVEEAKGEAVATLRSLDDLIQKDLGELKTEISGPIATYFTDVTAMLKHAVDTAPEGSNFFVQEFLLYPDVKGKFPQLHNWIDVMRSKLDAGIRGLDDHSHFPLFKNFLKILYEGTYPNSDAKTFFGTMGEDLKQKVNTVFQPYERNGLEFRKMMEKYIGNAGNGDRDAGKGKELLDHQISNIDVAMEKLKVTTADKSKYGIKEHEDVTTEINKLHSAITGALDGFTAAVEKLVKDSSDNSDVNAYLLDLEKMLKEEDPVGLSADGLTAEPSVKGLKQIKTDVENILTGGSNDNSLQKILQKAGSFYSTVIRVEAQNAIGEINKFVTSQVTEKTRAIENKARSLYSARKKEELEALKRIVHAQKYEIHKLIDENKVSGTKGLLNKIESWFPHNGAPVIFKTLHSFESVSTDFKYLSHSLLEYIYGQVYPNVTQLDKCRKALDSLLTFLLNSGHFDFTFKNQLALLMSALDHFHPTQFSNVNNPLLLDVTKHALSELTGELGKAYVNAYSGAKLITWEKAFSVKETKEGKDAAKVCLTLFEILSHDLNELKRKCKVASSEEKINQHTRLGDLLKSYGFIVSTTDDDQNGELKNKPDCKGTDITRLLVGETNCVYRSQGIGPLQIICNEHLSTYYLVRHLATASATKHPSSVYQMLLWFAGLPHNPVYNDLSLNGFGDLFEKPKEPQRPVAKESTEEEPTLEVNVADTGDAPIPFTFGDDSVLEAYPYKITATGLSQLLTAVCGQAHSMLTAILGHGHADGIYAVDFNTNEEKLAYPTSAAKCLDTLAELLFRLYHQLSFLNVQCERKYSAVSWRDCYYGRNIGGSSWECNSIQCPNQQCPQKVDQMGKQNGDQRASQRANQSADQTCELHPKCGLKSPLQSFLEDGLPGFLPHPYKKTNCNISCDMAKHRGLPCKTPMGFSDISVRASHTQKGEHLAEVLAELCGKPDSPLSLLCAQLTCLLQRAPQTLDDMFSFYYHLLSDWNKNTEHKQTAFNKAVTKANFGDVSKTLDVTSIFKCRNHRDEHKKGDLYSLVRCEYTANPEIDCGRYLQPMGLNTWFMFCNKNGSKYLSWIVYLTETFYDLLKKLYEECCNNCNKPGTRCYGKICAANCQVQSYYKSLESAADTKKSTASPQCSHNKLCKSIASCPFTRPTLSKYGFVLHSPYNLSGANGEKYKRTCQDLCKTLRRVISDVKSENNVLAKLVHETIPNFLFKIRFPFMTLTLALWLLSLLYLLHIMVIRLDLLHIKSHLHTPSSHRIAAQSLLAAARVNKLNRVFYLQP